MTTANQGPAGMEHMGRRRIVVLALSLIYEVKIDAHGQFLLWISIEQRSITEPLSVQKVHISYRFGRFRLFSFVSESLSKG